MAYEWNTAADGIADADGAFYGDITDPRSYKTIRGRSTPSLPLHSVSFLEHPHIFIHGR
jgi:hypothetical protein